MLEACITLEGDPAVVAVARRFVDRTVSEWELDRVRDDARLIVTELSANAVLHARAEFRVTLQSDGFRFLRIEVRDDNSRMPSPANPPWDATSGRGLMVVAAVAASWGATRDGDGKIVWAEIGSASPPPGLECMDRVGVAAADRREDGATPGESPAGEAVAL